ncbi:hypothetical protein ACD591_05320 [Rufibacter glacialis]|uniref:DUF4352 domain-containing protein n=1 Tax=Rufibacter glacialis TaxID=1259555 RepID=A0A5M8QJ21_9BACT|nr:hypothetical protein [Rufibacter glacialis]KAA6434766.1 hypothetical protein FOE74_11375 [Rufibacter glacialis]GGK72245.1 hypothetical protein GCM10011405_20600 [Rufibacter glacialis]
MKKLPLMIACALGVGMAACSQEKTTETTAVQTTSAPSETAPPASEVGVERTQASAQQPEPASATPALDTQQGPKGMQVALTKARVVGDILTIEVQYSLPASASGTKFTYPALDNITYIDDATSRKYNLLRDQAGRYMANPIETSGKRSRVKVKADEPGVASFKFPAPPATSQTVSVSIPEVGSFDGITVQR